MAKFSSKGLLGIAAALSLIVALLVHSYLNSVEPTTKADATVILAKTEIPPNTQITADMIEQVKIPAVYRQPGAIVDSKRIVGVVAKERILLHEQLTEKLLMVEGKATGFSGIIPPDKRAISIAVNDISGVAGLIKPGDYVDVIVAVDNGNADTLANMPLQNILVLAANKNIDRGDKSSVTPEDKIITITVAVTPDEATLLALAEVKGSIFFALRPHSPTGNSLALIDVKNLSSLRGGNYSVNETASSSSTDSGSSGSSAKTISVVRGTKLQEVPVK